MKILLPHSRSIVKEVVFLALRPHPSGVRPICLQQTP